MKKLLVVSVLLMTVPAFASAGLLGSVEGSLTGSSKGGSSSGSPVAASNQLVQQYVAGNISVLKAQKDFATALHLKNQVAKDEATIKALTSSSSGTVKKSTLEKNDKLIHNNASAILTKLKEKPVLSAADKVVYAQGLGALAGGILHYVDMKNAASSFSSSVSSLSPMAAAQDATELASGLYVVKSLPTSITSLGSTLNEAVSFAKSSKIAVPANATKALGSL